MDMTGEYRIAASRQQVWNALNDPDILKQCIPGCDELERVSETEMTAKVTAKVGPVKARFAGGVTLSDIEPPERYTITGEGKGGAAGFAKGSARVQLTQNTDETILHYEAHAEVGGKLAQLGNRLVAGTAQKMADDFFGRFSEVLATAKPEIATVVTGDTGEAVAPMPVPAPEVQAGTASAATENALSHARRHGAAKSAKPTVPSQAPAGLGPRIWIPGLIVLVLVLIWAFAG